MKSWLITDCRLSYVSTYWKMWKANSFLTRRSTVLLASYCKKTDNVTCSTAISYCDARTPAQLQSKHLDYHYRPTSIIKITKIVCLMQHPNELYAGKIYHYASRTIFNATAPCTHSSLHMCSMSYKVNSSHLNRFNNGLYYRCLSFSSV